MLPLHLLRSCLFFVACDRPSGLRRPEGGDAAVGVGGDANENAAAPSPPSSLPLLLGSPWSCPRMMLAVLLLPWRPAGSTGRLGLCRDAFGAAAAEERQGVDAEVEEGGGRPVRGDAGGRAGSPACASLRQALALLAALPGPEAMRGRQVRGPLSAGASCSTLIVSHGCLCCTGPATEGRGSMSWGRSEFDLGREGEALGGVTMLVRELLREPRLRWPRGQAEEEGGRPREMGEGASGPASSTSASASAEGRVVLVEGKQHQPLQWLRQRRSFQEEWASLMISAVVRRVLGWPQTEGGALRLWCWP